MNLRTIALSLAAGLLGGVLSHYLSPQPVHAESSVTSQKEIRAETFLLVNEQGTVVGKLSNDHGRAALRLFDKNGSEIWSAGGNLGLQRPATGK